MTDPGARAARTCFVHIGLQKTGTSYLQSILWPAQRELRGQGLALVPGSKNDTFTLMLAVRGRLREGIDPPSAYAAPTRLRDLVAAAQTPRLLITEESLAAARTQQVRRLGEHLAGVEVHVIVTVRDLARQIPSVWQQRITAGGGTDFASYVSAVREHSRAARSFWANQDLAGVLDRWSALAPPERTHVVTVPPAGSSPDVLLERFCAVLGVDPAPLETEVARSNTSLGYVQADLLRRVNVALDGRLAQREAYRETGKMYLSRRLLAAQGGERARVPLYLRDWIEETARAQIEDLAIRGVHVVGDPAELLPGASSFVADDLRANDAEVAAAAARALADALVDRHERLEKQRRARHRRPRRSGSSVPVAESGMRARPRQGTELPGRVSLVARVRSRVARLRRSH